jgi:hypothetical protein
MPMAQGFFPILPGFPPPLPWRFLWITYIQF